jgi:integrase
VDPQIHAHLQGGLAQVNFSAFLKTLEERYLHFSSVRPIPPGEFFEEYLGYVKTHQSRAWHEKQKAYIYESTRVRKEKKVAKLLPFFGKDELTTQVTSRMIEQYAESRKAEGARCTTINKELAAVRHAMKKVDEWGHVLANPARKVKDLPDDGKIRERFLSPDEYLLLLRDTGASDWEPWTLPNERFSDLRELVMLACNTGLRRSELLFLDFSDIDWSAGPFA